MRWRKGRVGRLGEVERMTKGTHKMRQLETKRVLSFHFENRGGEVRKGFRSILTGNFHLYSSEFLRAGSGCICTRVLRRIDALLYILGSRRVLAANGGKKLRKDERSSFILDLY